MVTAARATCRDCDWLAGDPAKETGVCLLYCVRHCPGPHKPPPKPKRKKAKR